MSFTSSLKQHTPCSADCGNLYALLLKSTVVLWVVGLLTVAQALVIVALAWTRSPSRLIPRVVAVSWALVGMAQFASSLLAGIWLEQTGTGVAQLASFGVVGWIFGGLAIWAGAAHNLAGPRTVRAITLLGIAVIVLSLVSALGVLLGISTLQWPYTLPMMAAPHSISVRLYGAAILYVSENTFGSVVTRLILFYPYTTALGLGGVGIALISTLERDWRYRFSGMFGGLAAVIFSWSRISLAALAMCIVVWCWLKLSSKARFAVCGFSLVCLFVASVANLDWIGALTSIQSGVDGVRAGSSAARELIYEKSWQGFELSPIFGNGWIGASVHPTEFLPIGSHSSVYGLLYTGGLLTFSTFVVAMSVTVISCLAILVISRVHNRDHIVVATLLSMTLVLFCKYESLFSITLPCGYIFAFIGGVLERLHENSDPIAIVPGGTNATPYAQA